MSDIIVQHPQSPHSSFYKRFRLELFHIFFLIFHTQRGSKNHNIFSFLFLEFCLSPDGIITQPAYLIFPHITPAAANNFLSLYIPHLRDSEPRPVLSDPAHPKMTERLKIQIKIYNAVAIKDQTKNKPSPFLKSSVLFSHSIRYPTLSLPVTYSGYSPYRYRVYASRDRLFGTYSLRSFCHLRSSVSASSAPFLQTILPEIYVRSKMG